MMKFNLNDDLSDRISDEIAVCPSFRTNRGAAMKVRITQTIEIDPKAWAAEFGCDPKDVREDVQAYFREWLQEQVERVGMGVH